MDLIKDESYILQTNPEELELIFIVSISLP
jgi:hypothetical protein